MIDEKQNILRQIESCQINQPPRLITFILIKGLKYLRAYLFCNQPVEMHYEDNTYDYKPLHEAQTLIKSKRGLYEALERNLFHLPNINSKMCTVKFLRDVMAGD